MDNHVHYVPETSRVKFLELDAYDGHGFQKRIAQALRKFHPSLTVEETPLVADGGKDIKVSSEDDTSNIFGMNFAKQDGRKLRLYIECKSSRSMISFETISAGLDRCKYDDIAYYVVATNTTLNPRSYYLAHQEAKKVGVGFRLMDADILAPVLHDLTNGEIGWKVTDEEEPVRLSYQKEISETGDGREAVKLYLLAHNQSNTQDLISFQINTDGYCLNSEPYAKFSLPPHAFACDMKRLTLDSGSGAKKPYATISCRGQETTISLMSEKWKPSFLPDLVGKQHLYIKSEISEIIRKGSGLSAICIWGDAGVGKSRVIQESFECNGSIHPHCTIKCTPSRNRIFGEIVKHFERELLIKKKSISSNDCLESLFNACDSIYEKAIIVLDDLHNAPNDFLAELDSVLRADIEKDILFILAGRNDYSAGSERYYSFIESCSSLPSVILPYTIKPLSISDTEILIKSVISGLPKELEGQILRYSTGTPLYVVALAEMLIDEELAMIDCNRSIRLINQNDCSNWIRLPTSLVEVYDQRINALEKLPQGEALRDCLLIAATYGMEFPASLIDHFAPREGGFELLLSRRLVIDSSNSNEAGTCYSFAHESFYLHLRLLMTKNEKFQKLRTGVAKKLKNVPILFDSLTLFEQGRVSYWAADIEFARTCFREPLQKLSAIENLSSFNTDPLYYNYREELIGCAKSDSSRANSVLAITYIALHHHTPFRAIEVSEEYEQTIHDLEFKDKEIRLNALRELRAHAYTIAGRLDKGLGLLTEVLAKLHADQDTVDDSTAFDAFDRLASVCLKRGHRSAALAFCKSSLKVAIKMRDSRLIALSKITQAKCLFYSDRNKARRLVDEVSELLTAQNADRIRCHNILTRHILDIMDYDQSSSPTNMQKLISTMEKLVEYCKRNSYANSIVRGYTALSVLYLLTNNPKCADYYADKALDASIHFGIGTYLWQAHNQKLILATRNNSDDDGCNIMNSCDSLFGLLRKQGLLTYESTSLCYGNVLALSNVANYYARCKYETEFYLRFSDLAFAKKNQDCLFSCGEPPCEKTCVAAAAAFNNEYRLMMEGRNNKPQLFLCKEPALPLLIDKQSRCFIVIS